MTYHALRTMTQRTADARDSSTRIRRGSQAPQAPAALPARVLAGLLFLALVAVASLPQARAVSATFGWIPLWLLLAPATAWLALRLRPVARGQEAAHGHGVRGALRWARAPQRAYAGRPGPGLATVATARRPRGLGTARSRRAAPAPR